MPLLIDGHNLIGKMGDILLSDPDDERKLIARVRSYAEKTGKRIAIVFDPAPYERHAHLIPSKSQHGANLSVVFADAGVKADTVIRERVGTTKDKQGLIVVTSDQAVAMFTRQCGVKVQSSEMFAKAMRETLNEQPAPTEKPRMSMADTMAWADVFKEPRQSEPPVPPPEPPKPTLSAAEGKKARRMEQLRKQTATQTRLR